MILDYVLSVLFNQFELRSIIMLSIPVKMLPFSNQHYSLFGVIRETIKCQSYLRDSYILATGNGSVVEASLTLVGWQNCLLQKVSW